MTQRVWKQTSLNKLHLFVYISFEMCDTFKCKARIHFQKWFRIEKGFRECIVALQVQSTFYGGTQ